MQRREDFGGAFGGEGIDVGDEGRPDECDRNPADCAAGELPLPGEVAGQDRQHEEAEVAGEAAAVLVQVDEDRGQLDDERCGHGEADGDDGVGAGGGPGVASIVDHDQLLPEAVGVLAGEFAGEGVELPHALHRDEERLVGRESAGDEDSDLLAQVVLEFGDVHGVDGLPAAKVVPPLVELRLERPRFMLSRHRSCSL